MPKNARPEGLLGAVGERLNNRLRARHCRPAFSASKRRVPRVERESAATPLVFMPFAVHSGRFYHLFGGDVDELLPKLQIVAMALAAQDVDLEADPDRVVEEDGAAKVEEPDATKDEEPDTTADDGTS